MTEKTLDEVLALPRLRANSPSHVLQGRKTSRPESQRKSEKDVKLEGITIDLGGAFDAEDEMTRFSISLLIG